MKRLQSEWLVAATSRELRQKPLGRVVMDTPIVLFRSHGIVAAMLDRCPHRNAPLAAGRVVGGLIQCPYHGWRFDPGGICIQRPGMNVTGDLNCDNQCFSTCERHGLIWVNLSETPVSSFPMEARWWSDPKFAHFTWTSKVQAAFVDGIENLLDATHTPFVHRGLVRSTGNPQPFRATVRVQDCQVEAEYLNEGKQAGWISRIFERNRASSYGRFIPPCVAELEYTSRRGTEFVLNSHFTPENDHNMRVYSTFFIRRSKVPMAIKRVLLSPFFWRVLKQDQDILRLQQANIQRFGSANYRYWDGDLLRGLIESWLRNGKFPQDHPERTFEIDL